jgi:hypothetical protein
MAHGAYEGMDKQYKQLQSSLRSVRQHLGSLVTPPTSAMPPDPQVSLLDETEGREIELEAMTPAEKATLFQGVLDYTRQLSEKVFTAFQTVSTATTFLPHNLKSGASHALSYSQELYTTLKTAKVPTDIPTSVLHKTSEVIETQLGYVKQLGTYIKSSLKAKEQSESIPPIDLKTLQIPDEAQEDSSDSDEGEPPIFRPPGGEGEQEPVSVPPGEKGGQADASLSSDDEK